MGLLGRYIVRTVLEYTGLVLMVLAALGSLFLFIGQQDDIGTGTYTSNQALMFVALNLPTYMSQMLPVAALIGALLGLGNLARGSEIVAMRAAGVTTLRYCLWLGVAGLVLAVLMVGIGEWVAPPLEQYARQMKVFSKNSQVSLAGNRGAWLRDGDTIISIQQQFAGATYGGVQVFRFDPARRLLIVGEAESASLDEHDQWRLEGLVETRFVDGRTDVRRVPLYPLRSTLSADLLGLAVLKPESMGLRDMSAYIRHLKRNDLDAEPLRIAFWSRVARVVALVLVVILALPFSLGSLRSSGQGAKAVIGILIGAAFIMLSQLLENSGQLLGLHPLIAGWGPTALLAALTVTLLARAR